MVIVATLSNGSDYAPQLYRQVAVRAVVRLRAPRLMFPSTLLLDGEETSTVVSLCSDCSRIGARSLARSSARSHRWLTCLGVRFNE